LLAEVLLLLIISFPPSFLPLKRLGFEPNDILMEGSRDSSFLFASLFTICILFLGSWGMSGLVTSVLVGLNYSLLSSLFS
jgi:hypothetical protein